MDVCVVTYRNDARTIRPALRPHDVLYIGDNSRRNLGFGAGANLAAAQGKDQLVCFLNPDGIPGPSFFDPMEAEFADPVVVACDATQGRGDQPDTDWLSGACVAVRRVAFEAVGGFDERLFHVRRGRRSVLLKAHGRLVRSRARFEHSGGGSSFRALHRNFPTGL